MNKPIKKKWKWNHFIIQTLAPQYDVDGRFLNGTQKKSLQNVGLTTTKWTQIRETGPKTIEDLTAVARLLGVEPGDLISIPKNDINE